MTKRTEETALCQICNRQKNMKEMVPAAVVREPLIDAIQKRCPTWALTGFICKDDLNRFRALYVQEVLEKAKGDISTLEQQVMKSLEEHDLLSKNVNIEFEQKLSFGERISDRLSRFAGSWTFILGFIAVLFLWIGVNSAVMLMRPFDPYPFILLNLVLSCLAAIQAPIILMSQNRQESKDRLRSEHDYLVNLKAELEIRHLHEKIDHLLVNQWQRLLEIQEIQTDLMEELARGR
jgi:uncharacterized membrane protein